MKKLITLATLVQLSTASASVVAIMDTGTDISHKDLSAKAWTNKKEILGSTIDNDGSGLPGDVHGWDFTEGSATVFNDKYNYLIDADVVKFYTLYAKYELKTINQAEFTWLKSVVGDNVFMNKVNFIGGYAHGTHCGGISALNNPKAEVMSLKILPTVYEEAVSPEKNAEPVQLEFDFSEATMTVEQLKAEIVKSALDQVKEMAGLHGYLKFQKVDVVNQSFGIGFQAAVGFIGAEFMNKIKREPTNAELADLVMAYFQTYLDHGPEMFKAAPTTLFVIAAGNDSSDNDKFPDYPADIQADNKIVVAATLGYSSLADFSNYGATKVDVAAPGVAILSTAPNQTYMNMSGTSQATPFVTNTISLVKDINPALTVAQIKSIVLKTVDVKPWLKGKVATSGIVNKARALKAAELSKTSTVDEAIALAKATIADTAVPKAFVNKLAPGMKLNYRPILPSLLVKKEL